MRRVREAGFCRCRCGASDGLATRTLQCWCGSTVYRTKRRKPQRGLRHAITALDPKLTLRSRSPDTVVPEKAGAVMKIVAAFIRRSVHSALVTTSAHCQ